MKNLHTRGRLGIFFTASARWLHFTSLCLIASCVCSFSKDASKSPATTVDFTREVRPILASHCFKCHGQDEGARKAKLRLDVRDDALKPAKSGELAIVPGKPGESELVRRISADNEDDLMPPPGAKNPLTAADKEILKRWIAEGAEYKPHWAFIAPKQSPPPGRADPANGRAPPGASRADRPRARKARRRRGRCSCRRAA